MNTRFLMEASVVAMGATVGASLALGKKLPKYPTLGAFLASEVLYRGYELGWGLGYEAACARECTYAGLGIGVALEAWWRSEGPGKRVAAETAAVGVMVLAGLGGLAMGLPGGHADYRGLIPVGLGAAFCLVTAHYESTQDLDRTACWGLGMVFLAQVGEYLGWEFSPSYGLLGAWVVTLAYLWVMLELAIQGARRG